DMVFADGRQSVTVYPRARLPDGFCAAGPLLLTDSNSTLIVEPGWVCKMIASGALVLEKMPDTVQKQALLSVPLSDMA
ncbi:hypothetical protein Q4595_30750, partial [Wenyingzhuangia sp. 1_MG-2023]|nr:hypothetical protein [Wenyingzhuangia sp. 1_MG-2023]